MRIVISGVTLFSLLVQPVATQAADPTALRGYTAADAVTERDWEIKFRQLPSPDRLRENMRRLSARPHHLGSPYDKDNAEWMVAQFRSWGLDANIESFDTLFPTPKLRTLELLEPTVYHAKLEEPALASDPTSNQKSEQLPLYNSYSKDGDVTAPLVYVNYGTQEDYEQLERLGVSMKGAIAIVRYGRSFRGIKPKLAAEHGAVGCIIYSDPHDDGYGRGDTYPEGATRPRFGAQRGTVMDITEYPGDPLTPGIGSTPDAKRLEFSQLTTLTKIPVLPISYGDAEPLLKAIGGPLAPTAWRGGLPIPYHAGPGPAKVHLSVAFNWDRKPLYDVIVRIPGSTFPDEWVIRGNHHDAWVNGAQDPISGASAELEEARGFAELLKQGWKPKRTVIFCLWDGEEEGTIGSTEWGEAHADELKAHAVAYINSDSNDRGFLGVDGSASLESFVSSVTRDIDDPETKMTVWKRAQLAAISHAAPEKRAALRSRADSPLEPLGAGSDYAVFADHLGIACLNIGFGGEEAGAYQYHSIYDDFYWYTHFADTDFAYGRALAEVGGTMVMRLADSEVLPFQFTSLADTVRTYLTELRKLAADKRSQIEEQNKQIEEGVFHATADPHEKAVAPAVETVPPYLNFAPFENAVDLLARSAAKYDKAFAKTADQGNRNAAPVAVNAKLIQSERLLTDPAGLPHRPWFQHMIYAPGFYTGYGSKTVPGVREAIEERKWEEADTEIQRFSKVLAAESRLLDAAAAELAHAPSPAQ